MDLKYVVERIRHDLELLEHQFATPSAEAFEQHHEAIELLEHALHIKTQLDASFTYSAMAAGSGSKVGSAKTLDYLTKRLGLSRAEAMHRMDLANRLHRAGDPIAAECQAAIAQQSISSETARIIDRELKKLDHSLKSHTPELISTALKAVSPDETRRLLRNRVNELNNQLDPDPTRARRKRSFRMGAQDRDGGVEFSGYAPAADAAMLEAALANSIRGGAAAQNNENRTFTQKRYDALMGIIRQHERLLSSTNRKGLGTIVLSLTENDLLNLNNTTQIRTNTSYSLTPYELLALGITSKGMSLLHGPEGDPIAAATHSRHATIEQKIILAVTEGVCTHPGCDQAAIWCDSHHITAWIQGGHTDLSNLTLLCRHHHTSNDDTKRRPDRGHAERCPNTKRVGYHEQPGAPPQFNDSYPANQSAGAQLRA
ncbi:HNH endonuclease signature motif containing protein [Corynebacterium sp. H130]|uniref:HNH endonuclease signature motif containing protein n=1 Tax=Corynebacterium sp. H130 TaxID=3133444 RepID=UPI00309A62D2